MFWEKYAFFQKCSKIGLVAKKNGYHFLGGAGSEPKVIKITFFEPFPYWQSPSVIINFFFRNYMLFINGGSQNICEYSFTQKYVSELTIMHQIDNTR